MLHEAQHHPLQLRLRHLPVRHRDARLRHQLLDQRRPRPDRIHPVVQEKDLPSPPQLQLHRRPDQLRIEVRHHRVDGQAVFGRRLDHRHVANAEQRHVQRARDGRRRHRQHVHVLAELLQPLLVPHAETLLLVHDQQSQVPELHIFRQQPVRADEHVHLAFGQIRQHRLDLLGRTEPAGHFHAHRERREAALEGFVVLEAEHRGRRQHRHLLAVAQRLEHRAHAHFGLSEAHVAA